MEDRNFDDLTERFSNNVYGNPKGELRLAQVWRELEQRLAGLAGGPALQVWDAGGGLGQMSQRLLAQGHRVVLNDISGEMLAKARLTLGAYEQQGQLAIRQQSIQQLAAEGCQFDLVLCHAVLEWVVDARAVIEALVHSVRAGGYLSLMFYNRNSLILSNMIKGNLYKLRDEQFAGHPGGLTPPHPREPQEILSLMEELGMAVEARRGVRLCYDLMPRALRAQRSVEDMLEIDWQYGAREPFWALGRYVHFLCRRC